MGDLNELAIFAEIIYNQYKNRYPKQEPTINNDYFFLIPIKTFLNAGIKTKNLYKLCIALKYKTDIKIGLSSFGINDPDFKNPEKEIIDLMFNSNAFGKINLPDILKNSEQKKSDENYSVVYIHSDNLNKFNKLKQIILEELDYNKPPAYDYWQYDKSTCHIYFLGEKSKKPLDGNEEKIVRYLSEFKNISKFIPLKDLVRKSGIKLDDDKNEYDRICQAINRIRKKIPLIKHLKELKLQNEIIKPYNGEFILMPSQVIEILNSNPQ